MSDKIPVVIYGDEFCAYCAAARMLFTKKGVAFEDVLVSRDPSRFDEMQERKNGGAFIRATVIVEKESQKGIVLGKGGSMIKKIGMDARRQIEAFMGYRVFLELFVKVEKKWRENPKTLKRLGFS